jgi:hypothetical protein
MGCAFAVEGCSVAKNGPSPAGDAGAPLDADAQTPVLPMSRRPGRSRARRPTRAAKRWCAGTESNRRHGDFQSPALPTELPARFLVSRINPRSRGLFR